VTTKKGLEEDERKAEEETYLLAGRREMMKVSCSE
jgi:hypothetical protein